MKIAHCYPRPIWTGSPWPPITPAVPRPTVGPVDVFERPRGSASAVILGSRSLRDAEKRQIPEKTAEAQDAFNEKRSAHNQKMAEAMSKVDQELSAARFDPKLSPEARQKRIASLMKKRANIEKQIKPPVDLVRVQGQVDAIMNDPNLDDGEKKKAIEQLRNELGLPKRGAVSMRAVTERLSKLDHEHAKRVGSAATQAKNHLDEVGKRFGVRSPEYLAAKSQHESLNAEVVDAKNRGGFLGSLYPKPKGFWGKLGGAFKKIGGAFKKVGKGIWKGVTKVAGTVGAIAGFAAPFLRFIPGVGQVAAAVAKGVEGFGKLVKGDWKGALGSALGAIPGLDRFGGSLLGRFKGIAGGVAGRVLGGLGSAGGFVGRITGSAQNLLSGITGRVQTLSSGLISRVTSSFGSITQKLGLPAWLSPRT